MLIDDSIANNLSNSNFGNVCVENMYVYGDEVIFIPYDKWLNQDETIKNYGIFSKKLNLKGINE